MAGITADMGTRVSEQKGKRIRERVAAGATRRAVAALEGVGLHTVNKLCRGMTSETFRQRGTGYRPTTEVDRGIARQKGWQAASQRLPESSCPYGTDQIALRTAWMAAYHDNYWMME